MADQHMENQMNRREFIRRAGILLVGAAAVLSGCGTPQSTAVVETETTPVAPQAKATSTPAVQQAQATSTPVAPQAQAASTPATASATAGVACPAGIFNDPFPGHCKRYVDKNGNGYCDLSEPGSGNVTARVQG